MRITKHIFKALYRDLAYGYFLEITSERTEAGEMTYTELFLAFSICVSAHVRSGSRIESQNMKSGGEGGKKKERSAFPLTLARFSYFCSCSNFCSKPA